MTVNGEMSPGRMGVTLPHEHVMSIFGAEGARYPWYDREKLFATAVPYLRRIGTLGCGTIVECTAAFFGRHTEYLRRISAESGIAILTNTGYYGAAQDRYVPPHAYRESAERIAERWTREFEDGIDETGIRPGFIKTAVDAGPLSEMDRKIVRASLIAHRRTGLPIQTHIGGNPDVVRTVLSMLESEGVHPGAWIWVHAHAEKDIGVIVEAAARGAWVSLDALSDATRDHIRAILSEMKRRDLLGRVLLSHDGEAFTKEGTTRPFEYLFASFLPLLAREGYTPEEVERITTGNPSRAFSIAVRAAS